MTRKPPDLPNIEDATLKACLAPLLDSMHAGADAEGPMPSAAPEIAGNVTRFPGRPRLGVVPDSAGPTSDDDQTADESGPVELPRTLAELRQAASEDAGVFRMVELFLGKSDQELEAAAAAFPRQIAGTLERLARLKQRLAARYEAVAAVQVLLRRAVTNVDAGGGRPPEPSGRPARHQSGSREGGTSGA